MKLTRGQLLDEMGLSPQWQLRGPQSVARAVATGSATASAVGAGLADGERATPEVATAGAPLASEVAQMNWAELKQAIAVCRACPLCAARKQAVVGVGGDNADWLFIGEGPGAEEDARGEPFVGQAGKLLDAMLTAIDLERGEKAYIANAVKCRPPGNRTPEASEIAACRPYLERQIELLQPKLIVLLGKTAVHALLGENGSLSTLRASAQRYCSGDREIPVVVTYHPAYLLRSLPEKAKAWEDLCRARALMPMNQRTCN